MFPLMLTESVPSDLLIKILFLSVKIEVTILFSQSYKPSFISYYKNFPECTSREVLDIPISRINAGYEPTSSP